MHLGMLNPANRQIRQPLTPYFCVFIFNLFIPTMFPLAQAPQDELRRQHQQRQKAKKVAARASGGQDPMSSNGLVLHNYLELEVVGLCAPLYSKGTFHGKCVVADVHVFYFRNSFYIRDGTQDCPAVAYPLGQMKSTSGAQVL